MIDFQVLKYNKRIFELKKTIGWRQVGDGGGL